MALRFRGAWWLGFFGLALSAVVTAQEATETLTNQTIVAMVQSHLSVDVILEAIRTHPGNYLVNPTRLMGLKEKGVPDEVIAAMQAKNAGASGAAGGSPSTGARTPASGDGQSRHGVEKGGAAGGWQVHDLKESMTDQPYVQGDLVARDDARERIEVSAQCTVGDTGHPFWPLFSQEERDRLERQGIRNQLALVISYASKTNRIRLMRSQIPAEIQRAPEFMGMSIGTDKVVGGGACVFTRVRVDDVLQAEVPSGGCGGENLVAIDLKRIVPVEQAFRANLIRVELPLSDGSATTIEIHPRDADFQNVAARCTALYRAHYPPAPVAPPPPDRRMYTGVPESVSFRGSPEEFARQFPQFVERAAASRGLEQHKYDQQTAYVIDVVRTCAGITPQMAQSATTRGGNEVLEKIGPKYRACYPSATFNPTEPQKPYDKKTERAMVYAISLPRSNLLHWRDSQGVFTLTAVFSALFDGTRDPKSGAFFIIDAEINSAGPAGGGALARPTPASAGVPARPAAANATGSPSRAAAPLTALQILAQVKEATRTQHKGSLLIFETSRSEPCKQFHQFADAPEIRTVLEKHFVLARLSVDEEAGGKPELNNPGAEQIMTTLGGNVNGEVPFLATFDSEGRAITTSLRPVSGSPKGKNIGYPATAAEIDWFMGMLKQSAPSLSEADSRTVRTWLQRRGHP